MEREYTNVAEEYGTNWGRLYSAGRSRTAQKTGDFTKKERFQWGKVLLCALLFLAMVVTKVNMPEQFSKLRAEVMRHTQQTVDYVDVFYSFGKAVSGEEPVGKTIDHVYAEVFGVQEDVAAVQETAAVVSVEENAAALPDQEKQAVETVEDMSAEGQNGDAAALASSAQAPAGAYMEQKILNLDYVTPVSGWLSSEFGYREHPVEGGEKFHRGIDIAAIEGSAVGAFAAGTVSAVGESSSLGNYVMLRHDGELTTIYGHCSKITAKEGEQVSAGQKIAEVGHTGLATGDHLHFAIRQGDTYLNPIYYVEMDAAL